MLLKRVHKLLLFAAIYGCVYVYSVFYFPNKAEQTLHLSTADVIGFRKDTGYGFNFDQLISKTDLLRTQFPDRADVVDGVPTYVFKRWSYPDKIQIYSMDDLAGSYVSYGSNETKISVRLKDGFSEAEIPWQVAPRTWRQRVFFIFGLLLSVLPIYFLVMYLIDAVKVARNTKNGFVILGIEMGLVGTLLGSLYCFYPGFINADQPLQIFKNYNQFIFESKDSLLVAFFWSSLFEVAQNFYFVSVVQALYALCALLYWQRAVAKNRSFMVRTLILLMSSFLLLNPISLSYLTFLEINVTCCWIVTFTFLTAWLFLFSSHSAAVKKWLYLGIFICSFLQLNYILFSAGLLGMLYVLGGRQYSVKQGVACAFLCFIFYMPVYKLFTGSTALSRQNLLNTQADFVDSVKNTLSSGSSSSVSVKDFLKVRIRNLWWILDSYLAVWDYPAAGQEALVSLQEYRLIPQDVLKKKTSLVPKENSYFYRFSTSYFVIIFWVALMAWWVAPYASACCMCFLVRIVSVFFFAPQGSHFYLFDLLLISIALPLLVWMEITSQKGESAIKALIPENFMKNTKN